MDLDLARTYLQVVEAGSFVGAAERLHITQAAVSRRIRTLEEALGCTLFTRNKGGAALTAGGRRFQRHAANLLRTFEQARHDLGSPGRFRASLVVGGRFGLWEQLLVEWLGRIRVAAPDISVRAEVGFEEDLMHRLVEGSLDIGVMYTPQSRPGLEVERLLGEELVLVSSPQACGGPCVDPGYVYVDWGAEFHARHKLAFPDYDGAGIVAGIGWLGLQHVLAHGGSGYFPLRTVRRYLASGSLVSEPGAPSFSVPAYVVYPSRTEAETIGPALDILRAVVREVAVGLNQREEPA